VDRIVAAAAAAALDDEEDGDQIMGSCPIFDRRHAVPSAIDPDPIMPTRNVDEDIGVLTVSSFAVVVVVVVFSTSPSSTISSTTTTTPDSSRRAARGDGGRHFPPSPRGTNRRDRRDDDDGGRRRGGNEITRPIERLFPRGRNIVDSRRIKGTTGVGLVDVVDVVVLVVVVIFCEIRNHLSRGSIGSWGAGPGSVPDTLDPMK
jgi:hypothetical protein